jgi:hypothetical protein
MEKSVYDSRCLTEEEWLKSRDILYAGSGWQWLAKSTEKRIYLRRHLSGPVSKTTEDWFAS